MQAAVCWTVLFYVKNSRKTVAEPHKRNVFASHLYNYENMARAAAEGNTKKAFPSETMLCYVVFKGTHSQTSAC